MISFVVLLSLLRIALGKSAEWKGEGSVDWTEVIGLARIQRGLAIAFDALEKVPAELQSSKNVLLVWLTRVNAMNRCMSSMSIQSRIWGDLSAEMGFI